MMARPGDDGVTRNVRQQRTILDGNAMLVDQAAIRRAVNLRRVRHVRSKDVR